MVFYEPTPDDQADANIYIFERQKLLTFNWYLKTMRHIFSYVIVEIHANHELRGHNPKFRDHCIYVRLKATKMFCEKLRCNMSYPRGRICSPRDELQIFKSGNTDVTACEPACFRLFGNNSNSMGHSNYGDDIELHGQLVQWSSRCDTCILLMQSAYSLGIDDYNRTTNHTTPHIDTIGTGYDLDDKPYIDKNGDESFHFKLNKYYCHNFNMSFYDNHCDMTAGEKFLGFFIGDTIYHLLKYTFTELVAGTNIYDVKNPNVPPTGEIPLIYSNWYSCDDSAFCINPNITLSQLGIQDKTIHLFWTTEFGWPGRLVEPLIIIKEPSSFIINEDTIKIDFSIKRTADAKIPKHLQILKNGRRKIDEYEIMHVMPLKVPTENKDFAEYETKSFFIQLFEFVKDIFSAVNLAQMGAEMAIESMIKYLFKSSIPKIAKCLQKTIPVMSKFLLKTFVKDVIARKISTMVVKTSIKILLNSAKIILLSIPIVDAIIVALTIFDVIFAKLDFLKINSLVDQSAVDSYSDMDIQYKKQLYGLGTKEYSPIYFITMLRYSQSLQHQHKSSVKSPILMQKIKKSNDISFNNPHLSWGISPKLVTNDENDLLSTIKFKTEYLMSLEFNSNGNRITWDDADDVIDEKTLNSEISHLDILFPDDEINYQVYMETFLKRMKKIKTLKLYFILSLTTLITVLFTGLIRQSNILIVFLLVILLSISSISQMYIFKITPVDV